MKKAAILRMSAGLRYGGSSRLGQNIGSELVFMLKVFPFCVTNVEENVDESIYLFYFPF